ncbi:MAG: rod-binding protein [Paracoccaceae bacterium]
MKPVAILPPQPGPPAATQTPRDAALRQAAVAFEANFLAEMLKPMGTAAARDTFGGGVGEEQFSTFLIREQARALADNGGIGLSEAIFQALKAREGGGNGK